MAPIGVIQQTTTTHADATGTPRVNVMTTQYSARMGICTNAAGSTQHNAMTMHRNASDLRLPRTPYSLTPSRPVTRPETRPTGVQWPASSAPTQGRTHTHYLASSVVSHIVFRWDDLADRCAHPRCPTSTRWRHPPRDLSTVRTRPLPRVRTPLPKLDRPGVEILDHPRVVTLDHPAWRFG